jgi:hypothetical protein
LGGCGSDAGIKGGSPPVNTKPDFVGTIVTTTYNGRTDDRLTLMRNRLRAGGTSRGGTPGAAPAISVATNLPPLSATLSAADVINFDTVTRTVLVPQ